MMAIASLAKKIKPDGSKTIYVGGIYEVDKTSGDTVTYYPAAGAMRINISGGSNSVYYILKDHLGSASVVTDSTGTIVGEQRYYPYGETRFTSGTIYTDKLFTGQREMTGLGIYHYGARFYSPKTGRFLSPDSIVPGAANPQAWNRYSYMLGNPIRYNDPTGHAISCEVDEDCKEVRRADKLSAGAAAREALAKYKVKLTGKGWNDKNSMAAFLGVYAIGNKLAEATGGSATSTFSNAYGSVTLEWVEGVCGGKTDRCYADANSYPTIKFYSTRWKGPQDANGNNIGEPWKVITPPITPALVIHELGHGFDSRTNRAFNQALIDKGITDKTGFGTVVGAGGQHEVTADLFTNWVLGTFTGPGTDEVDLQQFMDDNIETWVNTASTP